MFVVIDGESAQRVGAMNLVTLDFESFYGDDFTLSKLTTEEYVRDPRFEVHGCAIKWSAGTSAQWYTGKELEWQLGNHDWSNTTVVCHHAQFDGLILSHHFGIHPKAFICTLSMARLVLDQQVSKSLEKLALLFGLKPKSVPYDLFRGKHWHELSTFVQQQVAEGACDDVDITWDLLHKLAVSFAPSEYAMVDATVRMFTNPVLEGDTDRLAQIWQEEETRKTQMLDELGLTLSDLRKNWKFAELLRAEGIEPEQKPGKPDANGEPRWLYSFAKTDEFMRELLDHEDDRIRLLAETKLAAHSNITQTRTGRLGWMSTRGKMCVYLNYAGTHLAGWSGGDKVNWQNFKRNGPIAGAIRAPAGNVCIVADMSQVECRLLNMVAGQMDVIERFRRHEDPYVNVASQFYGYPVNKVDHPEERQVGKVLELQAGYGSGEYKIWITLKRAGIILPRERGLDARDAYRGTHPYVRHLWDDAGDVLKKMHAGLEFDWNVVHIQNKFMYLPDGVPIRYDSIEWHAEDDRKGFRVRTRRNGWTWIWGSKFVENLIQSLRNVLIKQAWRECSLVGLDMVSMEHDKLIAVVREQDAQAAFDFMREQMCKAPPWLPGIPLDSEGYISHTLAKE